MNMQNRNKQPTCFDRFNLEKRSVNIYTQTDINIVDQRFVRELEEVIEGVKAVEDTSMIVGLREALSIVQQNADDQNEFAYQLLENNRDIVSKIIQTIELFIENRLMYDALKLYTDENMVDIASEQASNISCFCKNLNGLTILFNKNHRILIQIIEQNCSKVGDVVRNQYQKHYEAVLYAIEQNSALDNYSIILANAREFNRHLPIIFQNETNTCIQQTIENNRPMPIILVTMFKFILWLIMITGIIMFGAFLMNHDDRIIMSMGVGFIFVSVYILIK